MNLIDIIVLIPIVLMFISGFRNGVVIEIATLIGLALGLWAALNFSDVIISSLNITGEYSQLIGYTIAFIGVIFLVTLLSKLLTKVLDVACLGGVNRILGGGFGALKAVVILAAIALLYENISITYQLTDNQIVEESILYGYLIDFAHWAVPYTAPVVEMSKDLIDKITQ